jgi:hypothetical protein
MSPLPAPDRAEACLAPTILAASALLVLALFWSQALHVPFWQDDYYFLLEARNARLSGESWFAPFLPEEKVTWWRPLGERTYWRFVEGVLGGSAQAAHLTNIFLLIASAAAVGWFTAALLRLKWTASDSTAAGVFAGFLYGVHSVHFLPAAWAAAANASLGLLFAALALRFWLSVLSSGRWRAFISAAMMLFVLVLSLLSRDIAFVLPALGLLLALWIGPNAKNVALAWVTGGLSVIVALGWLLLRSHFTLPSDPAYELRFGVNVLRNGAALLLFAFNMPFEALRFFFFVEPSFAAAAWGLTSLALQFAAAALIFVGARKHLLVKDLGILTAFFAVGCAPYFLLSVNCYPYYASLGLVAYAALAALAFVRGRNVPLIIFLSILASAVATLGNFFLESPSHIGRAKWAERQLVRLEAMRELNPDLFHPRLLLAVEDDHRYLGFRSEGIAYRLGLPLSDIDVREPPDASALPVPVLVVPRAGDVGFREPEAQPGP